MQIRATRPAPCREAVGEHAHDRGELLARDLRERVRTTHEVEQLVFPAFAAGDLGDDLLRQHVERRALDVQRIELAATHRIEQRGGFDEFVARVREQPPFRRAVDRVAGAADALQEGRDRARRADLADQIDIADIDAELERRGRDQRRNSPRFRRCSASRRCSLAMLPWCAVTYWLPSRSLKCRAARSAMRRVLTKISVVRCSPIRVSRRA